MATEHNPAQAGAPGDRLFLADVLRAARRLGRRQGGHLHAMQNLGKPHILCSGGGLLITRAFGGA